MFKALGYKWANTLVGCLAAIMVPIPFVHFFKRTLIFSHYSFKSVHRSFSFMDQLFGSEVNFRVLSWVCRTPSTTCSISSVAYRDRIEWRSSHRLRQAVDFESWKHLSICRHDSWISFPFQSRGKNERRKVTHWSKMSPDVTFGSIQETLSISKESRSSSFGVYGKGIERDNGYMSWHKTAYQTVHSHTISIFNCTIGDCK